jgi:drug/metabolite transporter (DMT)-like permease
MFVGVVAGLLAGAMWGLSFIGPLAVIPYTGFDLTVVRFAVYAAASLALLAPSGFRALRSIHRRTALELLLLGFTGYSGYYACAALAVPLAGAPLVVLIIGALPVVLALAGHAQGNPPLRRLAWPLAMVAAGLLIINGAAFRAADGGRAALALGVALAALGLALWTIYGLRNAKALAAHPGLGNADWAALTGLGAFASLLPMLPVAWAMGLSGLPHALADTAATWRLLVWGLATGIGASLVATWLWAMASRRLPVSLAAQLIVSETVFGVVYGLAWEGRAPTLPELVGSVLLIAGVIAAIRAFERASPELHHAKSDG